MNNIYIYNNNFISLLNLINILIINNTKPDNIKQIDYNPTLFDNLIKLNIDNNENIINIIIKNTSKNILKTMYYLYLSRDDNKELIIYYFYKNSLKYKDNIYSMRNLKCVSEALKISQYVSRENHKFKGFTRFKELKNNILYAEINPTNNIIYILAIHFKKRLSNEYFIIKDITRNIFSIYDKKDIYIVNGDNFRLYEESHKSDFIEDLWKEFYKTIGIESRKNNRCRMNFMPKKYWKYIVEMSDEI
ncbi:MAG: TIGR03915 family putative DNA repair protein [Bacilli bacterium]|nr:TIGR03915 family putative DNA repair protein [Bacilli bacterium]